mgnify:CR=1 FL=1
MSLEPYKMSSLKDKINAQEPTPLIEDVKEETVDEIDGEDKKLEEDIDELEDEGEIDIKDEKIIKRSKKQPKKRKK